MAKIYTTLFAAGALLFSGIGFAYAASAVDAPAVQAEGEGDQESEETEVKKQQPWAPKFKVEFAITNDMPVVNVKELIAPTLLEALWETDPMTWESTLVLPEKEIEGTMTIKITKWYENEEGQKVTETWKEWEEVAPGTNLLDEGALVDELPESQIGIDLHYVAYAIVDGVESNEYNGSANCIAGIRPTRIETITATADNIEGPINVSLEVPNTRIDSEEFPGITYEPSKVYVTREFRAVGSYESSKPVTIWEQENPEIEKSYSFVDNNDGEDFPQGTYVYKAYVEWKWGTSFESYTASCGLYPDMPANPTAIRATVVEEGALISWDAVTKSYNGGFMNPDEVKYSVYRFLGQDENWKDILEPVAEGISATECIDNLEGIDKLMRLSYKVMAFNSVGESYYTNSNYVVVGPACPLPFEETFSTPGNWPPLGPDMLWTSIDVKGEAGGWGASWQAGASTGVYTADGYEPIEPSEEGHGLVYTNFASYQPAGTTSYVSSDIDAKDLEFGKVTFRYYGHPEGSIKLYVDVMCDETVEEVEAGEGQPFVNVWNSTVYAEEAGWIEQEATFYGFANCNTINLRLRAISDQTEEDTVFIPACVEYIKVEAISEDPSKVEAINSDEVSVEYYDLQGIRLSAPVKGQPVIRRSVMNDGSVRASKVIAK